MSEHAKHVRTCQTCPNMPNMPNMSKHAKHVQTCQTCPNMPKVDIPRHSGHVCADGGSAALGGWRAGWAPAGHVEAGPDVPPRPSFNPPVPRTEDRIRAEAWRAVR